MTKKPVGMCVVRCKAIGNIMASAGKFARLIRWIISVELCILLTACLPANLVRKGLLESSPCAAPCWQGITPGDKLAEDVIIQKLNALPNVTGIWQPIPRSIDWHWNWATFRGPNAIDLNPDGTVQSLTLYIDVNTTVSEIIDAYGEPTGVRHGKALLPEEGYELLYLYYPLQGATIVVEVTPLDSPELTPASKVEQVTFSKPFASIDAWKTSFDQSGVTPWPKYGKLDTAFNPSSK